MKAYLATLNILTATELDQIDRYLEIRVVEKGTFLLNEHQVAKELYYVKTGVLRSFYWDYSGTEISSCIAFENEFMAAYPSFIGQNKSKEMIHALQTSTIEVINHADLEQLYNSSMNWQKIGRRLVESQYILMDQHVTEFKKQKSSHRYEFLLRTHPIQLNQIPQHYVASYLGISARQLTRIRKALLK